MEIKNLLPVKSREEGRRVLPDMDYDSFRIDKAIGISQNYLRAD